MKNFLFVKSSRCDNNEFLNRYKYRLEFLTRPIRHAFRFTVLMHSSTNSPESGLGESRTSLPGSGGEEYYVDEIDAQPPLGTCRALYPFDGTYTMHPTTLPKYS